MEEKNKRIAKNTVYLYVRMLFSLFVSLYTSRVVLHALGAEDYGIYNVVGGVVTMLAFLSGTMSTATQRFLSFVLGRGDTEQLKKTFAVSNTIILLLAIIIVICVETIGLWLLNNKLVIPEDRVVAAQWVFQFATIALFLQIFSVPYNAAIIAHEKMSAFAFIGIIDVVLKLLIALLIQYTVRGVDKLIFYSAAICCVGGLLCALYIYYCKIKFEECRKIRVGYDKEIGAKMLSFFGWNTIGAFAWVAKEQGVNIVINMFCGPIVNAARAVNGQVTGAIYGFITNFQVALNPQITMNYASGDNTRLVNLVFRGAKFSFFLFFFLALPIFIDIDYILNIWLIEVPEHTSSFIRLTLVLLSIETVSSPVITTLLATGNVKTYQIVVGSLLILNLPLSYFALKYGSAPEITMVIAIIIAAISLGIRLMLLRKYIGFPVDKFFTQVILRSVISVLVSALLPWSLYVLLNIPGLQLFIVVLLTSWMCSVVSILYVGTSKSERPILIGTVKKIVNKIRK